MKISQISVVGLKEEEERERERESKIRQDKIKQQKSMWVPEQSPAASKVRPKKLAARLREQSSLSTVEQYVVAEPSRPYASIRVTTSA